MAALSFLCCLLPCCPAPLRLPLLVSPQQPHHKHVYISLGGAQRCSCCHVRVAVAADVAAVVSKGDAGHILLLAACQHTSAGHVPASIISKRQPSQVS